MTTFHARRRWRLCYLDEHYIPSLLAFHGLDDETDCRGALVTANWTVPDAKHPLEYEPREIQSALCAAAAAAAAPSLSTPLAPVIPL